MLKTLVAEEVLEHDEAGGTYRAGPRLCELAIRVLRAGGRAQAIHRTLGHLASATGQSALYMETHGRPVDMEMRFIDKVELDGGVAYAAVGQVVFILAQGFGIGIMSQYPRPVVETIIAEHVRRTGEPAQRMLTDIERIRGNGVLARPERFGTNPAGATRIVAAVATPGFAPGCIGITVFGQESNVLATADVERWGHEVARAAQALTVTE